MLGVISFAKPVISSRRPLLRLCVYYGGRWTQKRRNSRGTDRTKISAADTPRLGCGAETKYFEGIKLGVQFHKRKNARKTRPSIAYA